jgi:ribonuclease-3
MCDYEEIYNKIGYKFKNNIFLDVALTHPSITNFDKKCENYQRLELLGDSVLSLVILDMLLFYFPSFNEGEIATRKAELVSNRTLVEIALELEFGKYIRMSKSEEKQNGRNNHKILEDIVESIIGAIYTDGGLDSARSFINKYWCDLIKKQTGNVKNPKSRLQEWSQKNGYQIPEYESQELLNDGNIASHSVKILIDKMPIFDSIARTKKEGEVEAAKKMLEYIKNNMDENI